jgi:hypothetical protein
MFAVKLFHQRRKLTVNAGKVEEIHPFSLNSVTVRWREALNMQHAPLPDSEHETLDARHVYHRNVGMLAARPNDLKGKPVKKFFPLNERLNDASKILSQ